MKLLNVSTNKYLLKEPFIFDFNRFARQTFSLVAVVTFICALFLFSGVFLDATAEEGRAETMPVVAQEETVATEGQATESASADELSPAASTEDASAEFAARDAARDSALDAISDVLGDFVEITPFNEVFASNWTALRSAVIAAGNTPTVINIDVPSMTSSAPNANAIEIPAGANITIRSTAPMGESVIAQATVGQRHFTVNGTLTVENVILCGVSIGTIFRVEYFFPFSTWADSLNPGEDGANNNPPRGGDRLAHNPQMGGGVAVTGGTFNLGPGGVIRRSVANYGGAVEVTGNGVFNLLGGSIGGGEIIPGGTTDGNAAIRHGGGISANGANARVNIYAGEVSGNRVVGKEMHAAVPVTTIPNQRDFGSSWNWPTSGAGVNTVRLGFPARFDFPNNVSRGGGGIAIRGGSSLVIRDNARPTFAPGEEPQDRGPDINRPDVVEIAHNFAERGGGIYVYGLNSTALLDHVQLVIRDNVTRHSYTRPEGSTSPATTKPASPPNGSTLTAAQWANLSFQWPAAAGVGRSWAPNGWTLTTNDLGQVTGMSGNWTNATGQAESALVSIPWGQSSYSGGGAGIHVRGGGATAATAARVDMIEGRLTRNVAAASTGSGGGGVFVGTRGTFNHFGGEIGGSTLNDANRISPFANQHRAVVETGSGAGVAVIGTSGVAGDQARFNMGRADGTVTCDTPAHIHNNQRVLWGHGAGVAVRSNGIVTMRYNAEIAHNVGTTSGGVFVDSGTLHMRYNSIIAYNRTNNGASDAGGGIHMQGAASVVTMNQTARIHSNRYNFPTSTAANPGTHTGAGVNMTAGTFTMNDSASIDNNRATSLGGGVSITSGTFNMNGNSVIRNNTAANTGTLGNAGGGVRMAGGTFNMGRQLVGTDAPRIEGNSAGNAAGAGPAQRDGGGVFMTGGTFNMWAQSVIGSDVAANRNFAGRNGGGVLMQGTTAEFIMNQNASVRGNTASINGGGLHLSDSTRFTMNNGTIQNNTATGTTAAANDGHGGGIFVASNRIGTNPTHGAAPATVNTTGYGVRINAGTLSNNNASTGDGGAIFSTRYTYRSPLVNNPLLDDPFVDTSVATNVSHRYNNLNISSGVTFSGNVSRQWSYPPIGSQLTNVAWSSATGSSVSRAGSPLYVLNNHDINFRWAGHDFWFIKEDTDGNPLPGATFSLQRGTGAVTSDTSRVNGLVGFPRAVGPVQEGITPPSAPTGRGPTVGDGPAHTYTLRETAVPANMNILLPAGHWTFTLNDNRRTEIEEIESHAPASSTLLNPAFSRAERAPGPNVFTPMAWRVYNTIIQPASFSFFKTDMSIYDSAFTGVHPRLAGAEFRLYKYTPQSASTQFADAVPQPLPTSGQPGFGYWTHITGNLSNGNISDTALAYTLNFYRNQPTDWFNADGSPAIFHLLEMVTPAATPAAPDGFVRPTGQWRFTLTPLSTGSADISVGLAPGSTNPAFVWVGPANTGAYYVGNEPYLPIVIGTGLFVQNSNALFFIVLGVAATAGAAGLAVRHRKNIEELSKLL